MVTVGLKSDGTVVATDIKRSFEKLSFDVEGLSDIVEVHATDLYILCVDKAGEAYFIEAES